jgi:hypothetical protein
MGADLAVEDFGVVMGDFRVVPEDFRAVQAARFGVLQTEPRAEVRWRRTAITDITIMDITIMVTPGS